MHELLINRFQEYMASFTNTLQVFYCSAEEDLTPERKIHASSAIEAAKLYAYSYMHHPCASDVYVRGVDGTETIVEVKSDLKIRIKKILV